MLHRDLAMLEIVFFFSGWGFSSVIERSWAWSSAPGVGCKKNVFFLRSMLGSPGRLSL